MLGNKQLLNRIKPSEQTLRNALKSFIWGIFGAAFLFLVNYLYLDILRFKFPFPSTFLETILHILIINAFIEEGIKFCLIKKKASQGALLGFGFGLAETMLVHPLVGVALARRASAIFIHILTGFLIAYFARRDKVIWGFLLAIIIHFGYDLLIEIAVRAAI